MLRCWYLEKVMMFWHFELATSFCCSTRFHPHAPSASDLLGSGIHLPTHLAVGVSAEILQVAGYTRYASLVGLTPVAKSTIHGVIAGPFAPATARRKKLQHDVNTVIWPCRLQWRFNYINHSDEKTTDKRNNMTDMTTIWNTLSLCQKPVQTPLRLHEGATAKLSTASAFLPDSYIIKMLESDSQELSFQARSYWQRQFVTIPKRCRFLVLMS